MDGMTEYKMTKSELAIAQRLEAREQSINGIIQVLIEENASVSIGKRNWVDRIIKRLKLDTSSHYKADIGTGVFTEVEEK